MLELKLLQDSDISLVTYLLVLWQGRPIGLCLYYKCVDSSGEDFGTLPLKGSYGIDYLIGEESCLGKGLETGIVNLLVDKIFSLKDARSVTADIDKDNEVSEKTLMSCGFSLLDEGGSRYILCKEPSFQPRKYEDASALFQWVYDFYR